MANTKITAANIDSTSTGITFADLTVNGDITGTLATAAQPNITSVGTLTGLDVAGTPTFDGLTVDGTTFVNLTARPTGVPATAGALWSAQTETGNYGIVSRASSTDSFTYIGNTGSTATLGTSYGSSGSYLPLDIQTSDRKRIRADANGDISFYEDTGTSQALFWDASAESLGIGTTSPRGLLEVGNAAGTTDVDQKLYITGDQVNAIGNFATLVFSNSNRSGGSTSQISAGREVDNIGTNLQFYTHPTSGSETERVRIDSAGRVGIGTNSPSQILHVKAASPNILLEGTNFPSLKWAGTDLTADAEIYYGVGGLDWNFNNYNNGRIVFKTNNLERLRILESGGITFNGDSAAANALDDYEEGTFTPTVNSGTSITQWAKYTKIGDTVYIVCEVTLGGTRTANSFEVQGLPFTNGPNWTPCAFYCQIYNSEGTQQVSGAFRASSNTFRVINFGSEALGTDFGNGYFAFSGTYKIQ